MANSNELIYVVKYENDVNSLKQVQEQLASLQQQQSKAVTDAQNKMTSGGGNVKAVKELTEAEARLRLEQQARTIATLDSVLATLAAE